MEPLYMWRSFPHPYKRVVVSGLRVQKWLTSNRCIRKTLRRAVYIYQIVKPRFPLVERIEQVVKKETVATVLHTVMGDDPMLYIHYSFTLQSMALRLLFQSLVRDMYWMHLMSMTLNWLNVNKAMMVVVSVMHMLVHVIKH